MPQCLTYPPLTIATARVAVHFNAITDKFTPHDTTFSISTADELSDAALASACSLHTAAPSSSSSSLSSRKQKLDEITEDAEDGQSTAGASESASTARPPSARTVTVDVPESVMETPANKEANKSAAAEASEGTAPEPSSDRLPELHELVRTHTAPGPDSFKNYDTLFEHGPDPRLSSQTARPDLADLYAEIYAQYNKPKVKLGPRPKMSLDMKRPSTSGSGTQSAPRAVSSLPPGMRSSNRKHAESKRLKSKDGNTVPSITMPPPPPMPVTPDVPLSPMYQPKSPGSIRSLPMNTYSSLNHKSSGVAQERQRLMKALQLRKKQMEARKVQEEKETEAAAEDAVVDEKETAKDTETIDHADPTADAPTPTDAQSEPRKEETIGEHDTSGGDEMPHAPLHEDIEVGMTPTRVETDDMHSAVSASSPTSAQTQGSSVAPSTRPSSISEDDNILSENIEAENGIIQTVQNDTASTENGKTSAESTPTVIPEDTTPIPRVEISGQEEEVMPTDQQDTISNDEDIRKKNRESVVLKTPAELEEARARRKSKRASMMLPLSPESLRDANGWPSKISPGRERLTPDVKETRGLTVDPNHLSTGDSEADYLSDDSFMEELQSAKFEEAMPVSVSKSPIMPFFPRKPSTPDVSVPKRSASTQNPRLSSVSPVNSGPRKLSGPWLNHSNSDSVVVAKKINVGSGISQRIKALAEKSNRESTASLTPVLTSDGGSSIVAQRKSSFFSTPPDGNSPNGKSVNRISRASFINVSRSTTPEPKPVTQTPPTNTPPTRHQTVYNVQQEVEQPESVQVTARIIRDAKPQTPTLKMPTETSPLELHQSPIIIDHQKSARPPTSSSRHSPIKTEPASPRPPSSSQSNEPSNNPPRSSSEASWRSFGRRLSESKNGGPPRSMSANSFDISSSDEIPAKKEKKDSRTSKLFKRMSSISSITRKNSASNVQEDLPPIPLPSLREPPSAVQVGDLNIQFPDTLVRAPATCIRLVNANLFIVVET